jgi:protein-tyrosine phosphatase
MSTARLHWTGHRGGGVRFIDFKASHIYSDSGHRNDAGGILTFSVLTVCTGNICRSPMAEGLLLHRLPHPLRPLVSVASAGTHGLYGNRAEPHAVRAAAERGADISGHQARILTAAMIRSADLILTMEQFHIDQINSRLFFRCKYAHLLGMFAPQRDNPEIEDPYGMPYAAYAAAADAILECTPGVIDYIRRQVEKMAAG